MTLRYVVLGLLSERANHGYQLKRRIEERLGSLWQVNVGQVYQTLVQLDRQGLARSRMEPTDQLRVRRVYEITEKGRRALATWLRRRPAKPGPVRAEIVVRLLGIESGQYELALKQLQAEEEVYTKYLEALKDSQQRSRPVSDKDRSFRVSQIALDIALHRAQAHLRWLRSCREEVRRMELREMQAVGQVGASRLPMAEHGSSAV